MNKTIWISTLLLAWTLFSCGSSKPVVHTTKKAASKSHSSRTPTRTTTTTTQRPQTPSRNENLEATSNVSVTGNVVQDYILRFAPIAQHNMREHGIPASITLAQGILESGSGRGKLAQTANNHFGIKCHKEWNGPSVTHDDDAKGECFRKYQDPAESYRDHSLFLTSRPRYADLFKLRTTDYKGWAHGLKKAGYATDPKYPSKLISLIERYELHRYDNGTVVQNLPKAEAPKRQQSSATSTAAATGVQHTVIQGDTLYSISRKYNTTVEAILSANQLPDHAISIGQTLKIPQ